MGINKITRLFVAPLLLLCIFLLTSCAAGQKTPVANVTDVTAKEAYNLTQQNRPNPDFVILDVRTPQEFGAGHIAGAVNLDFYSPTFRANLGKLDKNKTYLLYCRTGNRSRQALTIMQELKFKIIYHLASGFVGWEAEGLTTVKEPTAMLRGQLPANLHLRQLDLLFA